MLDKVPLASLFTPLEVLEWSPLESVGHFAPRDTPSQHPGTHPVTHPVTDLLVTAIPKTGVTSITAATARDATALVATPSIPKGAHLDDVIA